MEWIELILGVFILIYSSLKLVNYVKGQSQIVIKKEINTTSPLILFVGFSYGLLTGLIGAAGPINVALLEKTGHYRESFIGNFAAIGTVLSVSRIPFYLVEGLFPSEYY